MDKSEKEILINEIRKYNQELPIYLRNKTILDNTLPKTLIEILNDKILTKQLLIENKYGILANLLYKYKDNLDEEILLEIYLNDIKKDISIFNLIPNEKLKYKLAKNKDISIMLLEYGLDIKYINQELLDDIENIRKIIKNNPDNLYYASNRVKKDRNFILEIIKDHSKYYNYIDESLKKDKIFLKDLIDINGSVIEYLDENIKQDREFMLEILKDKPYLFKYTSEYLKQDKDLVLELLKKNIYIFEYLPEGLKQDKNIINMLERRY